LEPNIEARIRRVGEERQRVVDVRWLRLADSVVRPEQRTKANSGAGFQPLVAVRICKVSR
jgi:hypothetical protein